MVIKAFKGAAARRVRRSELSRQRHVLRHLDDRLLADIGMSRAAALQEARRSTWDVPEHWRS